MPAAPWLLIVTAVTPVLTLLAFGLLTGITTALFGFGGGFVVVPVIYMIAGDRADAMHVAVATSTAVMIVNAAIATVAARTVVRVHCRYLWPLLGFVAAGALVGAPAAVHATESFIHVVFIVYLVVTITDSIVRAGFLAVPDGAPRPLGGRVAVTGGIGIGIGAIASFLGVGGSVMTVPLLRRRGLPMAAATALANPLTVPVAVIGTLVYALVGDRVASGSIGYVDMLAAGVLLSTSLPTIVVTRRLVRHVPDRIHAYAYVTLLSMSLIAMLLV